MRTESQGKPQSVNTELAKSPKHLFVLPADECILI